MNEFENILCKLHNVVKVQEKIEKVLKNIQPVIIKADTVRFERGDTVILDAEIDGIVLARRLTNDIIDILSLQDDIFAANFAKKFCEIEQYFERLIDRIHYNDIYYDNYIRLNEISEDLVKILIEVITIVMQLRVDLQSAQELELSC